VTRRLAHTPRARHGYSGAWRRWRFAASTGPPGFTDRRRARDIAGLHAFPGRHARWIGGPWDHGADRPPQETLRSCSWFDALPEARPRPTRRAGTLGLAPFMPRRAPSRLPTMTKTRSARLRPGTTTHLPHRRRARRRHVLCRRRAPHPLFPDPGHARRGAGRRHACRIRNLQARTTGCWSSSPVLDPTIRRPVDYARRLASNASARPTRSRSDARVFREAAHDVRLKGLINDPGSTRVAASGGPADRPPAADRHRAARGPWAASCSTPSRPQYIGDLIAGEPSARARREPGAPSWRRAARRRSIQERTTNVKIACDAIQALAPAPFPGRAQERPGRDDRTAAIRIATYPARRCDAELRRGERGRRVRRAGSAGLAPR